MTSRLEDSSTVETPSIIGLALAGGQSSRMGTPKQDLLFQGRSLVEHTCHLLSQLSPACTEIVVSGYKQPGYLSVDDLSPRLGPLGGIYAVACDLSARKKLPACLLVLPIDMPLLSTLCLNSLVVHGVQNPGRAYFYQGSYLPGLIPINGASLDIIAKLNSPSQERSARSLRALYMALAATALVWQQRKELANFNTPLEWEIVKEEK